MNKFSKMVLVGMVLSTSVQAQEDSVSVRVDRDTLFGNGEPTKAAFVRGDLPYYLMWQENGLKFTLSVPLQIVRNRNVSHRGADWVPSNQPAKRDEWEVVIAPRLIVLVDGISKCLEGVHMTFLFDDNSKIDFMNTDSFNCGGTWVQPLNDENTRNEGALPSLMRGMYDRKFDHNRMAKPLKAVRFINVRSGTVSIYVPKDEMEKNYFIEIANAWYSYTHHRP